MRNCRVCTEPLYCDCLCSTCCLAREMATGKSDQMRAFAAEQGIPIMDIPLSEPKRSPGEQISTYGVLDPKLYRMLRADGLKAATAFGIAKYGLGFLLDYILDEEDGQNG